MPPFSKLILTIGIPGSGKSYWVKNYLKQYPTTHVVSTDDIRKELTGNEQCIDPSQSPMIHEEARKRVYKILSNPKNYDGVFCDIIVDSTNVEVEEWRKYKALGATILAAKIFDITPEQAMRNQENRERKVPLEAIEMKWKQLEKNKPFIPHYFNIIF